MTNILTNIFASIITTVVTNPPVIISQYDAPPCQICLVSHHQLAVYKTQVVEVKSIKCDQLDLMNWVSVSQRVVKEFLTTNEVARPSPFLVLPQGGWQNQIFLTNSILLWTNSTSPFN